MGLRALVIGGNGSNQEKDGNIKNGRCEKIERMSQSEGMSYDFDPPVFSPCVPARSLRNKNGFLLHAGRAGLIPDEEWNVMRPYLERREKEREKKEKEEKEKKGDDYNGVPNQKTHTTEEEGDVDDVLDLLTKENVPIIPGRRGASWDVSVHYSVELWRKGRRLGRGRAVLGCLLAHLYAMKKMTTKPDDNDDHEDRNGVDDDGDYGAFDFILENNVRSVMSWEADGRIKEEKKNSYGSNCDNNDDVVDENKNDNKIDEKGNNRYNDREYTYSTECARRMWGAIDAGRDLEDAKDDVRYRCHLRYYGFLGSIPNLDYVYNHHVPKTCHGIRVRETKHDGDCVRNNNSAMESLSQCSISTTPLDTVRGCIQYDNAVFPFPLSKDYNCLEKKGKKNMEENVKDEGKENSQKEKNEENNNTNEKHETKDIIVKPILLSDSKKEKNKME